MIIADDSFVHKTGENMELVSYDHDHTTNRSRLGYQMLQVGYHNGTRFYPLDMSFHTSTNRPNVKIREIDKRANGWKRRIETFEKKTELLSKSGGAGKVGSVPVLFSWIHGLPVTRSFHWLWRYLSAQAQ